MFMRTHRLFLRPIWAEDWRDLMAGADNAGELAELVHMPAPADEARALETGGSSYLPSFLITRPATGEGAQAVGWVGLAEERGEVVLSCWIAHRHRDRGYACEAARGLLTMARVLGHRRIVAHPRLDGPAASRLLRRLGFRAAMGQGEHAGHVLVLEDGIGANGDLAAGLAEHPYVDCGDTRPCGPSRGPGRGPSQGRRRAA